MRRLWTPLAIASTIVSLDAALGAQIPRRVIGYYTSWSVYSRNYHVANIPAQKVTHVNHAFANVRGGKIALGDVYADTQKFYPGDSWAPGTLRGNFNQLKKLKAKHPHLKVMISVGGWTWSGGFSDAVLTAASRQAFAKSCVDFIVKYDFFDGLDIDWEYPGGGGLSTNTSRLQDPQNFTMFLAELRKQLTAKSQTTKRKYFLTIAASADPVKIARLETAKIHPLLDWINVMSFDFHGPWKGAPDPVTNFHTALYADPKSKTPAPFKTTFNVSHAIETWLARGVPRQKLQLSLAFYGRGFGGVGNTNNGLWAKYTGVPAAGTWENGVFDYTDLVNNYIGKNGFVARRHANARVPWLFHPGRGIMIGYDDPQSIEEKVWYAKAAGLGGVMFWEFSGDRKHALLDVIDRGIRRAPTLWSDTRTFALKKPVKIQLHIESDSNRAGRAYVMLLGFSGRRPGLWLPGGVFPLNHDALFDLSLALANSTALPNTRGRLSANGTASMAIDFRSQPTNSALIGRHMTSAAWILNGRAPLAGEATNPVDVFFVN